MEFLLVGTDRRQDCLAALLKNRHRVFRFESGDCPTAVDAIALPCPSFDAAGRLRATASPDDLRPFIRDDTVIFCCGGEKAARDLSPHCLDLLSDEVTVLENARLTAEAALLAVSEHTQDSLHGKRCLTVGCGRIGTYLTRLLRSLGANCTVFARRASTRALAEGFGWHTAAPGKAALEGFDFVFNTVPAQALSRSELSALPQTCVWVELASAPGGLPTGGAPFAFSVLPAGGLPGKYLPHAAARVLYDAIERQIGI